MNISSDYFLYINIILVLIYIIFAIIGYKNGLMVQIIDLIFNFLAIFAAYFISPILASHFPLVTMEEIYTKLNINRIIDTLIYCVIVYVILRIFYIFIKPVFKSVSKVPLIGFLNKVGGFLLGIVNATFIMLALGLLLTTPLFSNGIEVKKGTFLKYTDKLCEKAIDISVKYINFDSFKETIDDFDINSAREEFNKWLIEKGVFHE